MKLRLMITLILVGVLTLSIGIGTFAWFTSDSAPQAAVITTGTLNLSVDKSSDASAGDTKFDFNLSNVQPGDTFAPIDITIKNTGSLSLAAFKQFALTQNDANLAKAIIIDKFTVTDWSGTWDILPYKASWGAELDGNAENLSLYDLCNSQPDAIGAGCTGIILNKGETQRIQLTFRLDGALATNSMQNATASAVFKVYGTQARADAIAASLEGKSPFIVSQAQALFNNQVSHIQ